MLNDITQTALIIATTAHAAVEQKRNGTGAEYITHPIAVAKIVAEYTSDPLTIAGALLHDVIEDTGVTEHQLRSVLTMAHGKEDADIVVDLVLGVTKVSTSADGERTARRAKDHAHFASGDYRVHIVKTADSLHNVGDIDSMAQPFRVRYIPEKRDLAVMMILAPATLQRRLIDKVEAQHQIFIA